MKKQATRHPVSSRELLALATFATMANSAAQDVAAPSDQASTLSETVINAEQGNAIKTETLSSNKSTAPLLNTPQTYSVVPKEVYNQQSARNLTDVLKNTPGISFNAGENGFAASQDNFSMRGTDASGSIYVDGIRDSGSYTRDIYNIEQVEIAKGPAADNGRGGAGGYVNMVTKTARAEDFFRGTTSYGYAPEGGDGLFRQTFDWNQQVGNGSAFRLNA
ncbi:MAG: TonB-dependent receptor plug domain-containing protein, partial [Verrucomicrobiales bacterium]